MHTWKTNGAINWTGDNAKQIDCDFSCKGGFKYHNTGKNRGCTACAVNQWTPDDNQSPDCKPCNPIPANAHYTGSSNSPNCKWKCDPGYNNVGDSCRKAVWTKKIRSECRVRPGRWKDSYTETYRVCSDGNSDNVSAQICNHWGTKPNNSISNTNDESCNRPQWTSPTCGECNGRCGTVSVSCSKSLVDGEGNSYDSSTRSESKNCGDCDCAGNGPGQFRICSNAFPCCDPAESCDYEPGKYTGRCSKNPVNPIPGGGGGGWDCDCQGIKGRKQGSVCVFDVSPGFDSYDCILANGCNCSSGWGSCGNGPDSEMIVNVHGDYMPDVCNSWNSLVTVNVKGNIITPPRRTEPKFGGIYRGNYTYKSIKKNAGGYQMIFLPPNR